MVTTRYWQYHVRPMYPRPRKRSRRHYVATITSTTGLRRTRAYAMTLPQVSAPAAAAAARGLMELIFKLETDQGVTP